MIPHTKTARENDMNRIYIGHGAFEGPEQSFLDFQEAMARLAGITTDPDQDYTDRKYTDRKMMGNWRSEGPGDIIEILTCHHYSDGWFNPQYALPLAWRVRQAAGLPEAGAIDASLDWCPGDFTLMAKRFAQGMEVCAESRREAHVHDFYPASQPQIVEDEVLLAIRPQLCTTPYPAEHGDEVKEALMRESDRIMEWGRPAHEAMWGRDGRIMPSLQAAIQKALRETPDSGCPHLHWQTAPAVQQVLLGLPREEILNYRKLFKEN